MVRAVAQKVFENGSGRAEKEAAQIAGGRELADPPPFVYTLFGYVSPLARCKGEWVRFDQLKDTSPFSKAFQEGIIAPFSRMFSGRAKELSRACEQLGGKRLPWSDAGYELKAFECIPVRFLFWDGDEEFPAQGNVLFDVGATDFIHGESVVTIAGIGLYRIAKLAGVPMDPSAFPIF